MPTVLDRIPSTLGGFLLQGVLTVITALTTGYLAVELTISKISTELEYISKTLDDNHTRLEAMITEQNAQRDLITTIKARQDFNMQRLDNLEKNHNK